MLFKQRQSCHHCITHDAREVRATPPGNPRRVHLADEGHKRTWHPQLERAARPAEGGGIGATPLLAPRGNGVRMDFSTRCYFSVSKYTEVFIELAQIYSHDAIIP